MNSVFCISTANENGTRLFSNCYKCSNCDIIYPATLGTKKQKPFFVKPKQKIGASLKTWRPNGTLPTSNNQFYIDRKSLASKIVKFFTLNPS